MNRPYYLAILMVIMSGCSAPAPNKLERAHEAVTNFNATGEYLNFRVELGGVTTADQMIEELSDAVSGISRALSSNAEGRLPETRYVSLDIRSGSADAPDRFGNYRFALQDFVSSSGVRDPIDILNDVDVAETGSGDMVIAITNWCVSEAEEAIRLRSFCDKVGEGYAIAN